MRGRPQQALRLRFAVELPAEPLRTQCRAEGMMRASNREIQTRTPLDRDAVRARFLQRTRERGASHFCYLTYHLIRWIPDEHLDGLEARVAYCGKPENLECWHPDKVDQVVISLELVQGLRPLLPAREPP